MTVAQPTAEPAPYAVHRPDHHPRCTAVHVATASEPLDLARYSTDIATAAVELASAHSTSGADELAIAQALIRTATAIQNLAQTLIDRHHTHPARRLP